MHDKTDVARFIEDHGSQLRVLVAMDFTPKQIVAILTRAGAVGVGTGLVVVALKMLGI